MKQEILDILMSERMEALEDIASGDEEYQAVRKEQMQTQKKLETMGLTNEQKLVVQELLSNANQSGAIYGKIAYGQGVKDGAKLMSELKGII